MMNQTYVRNISRQPSKGLFKLWAVVAMLFATLGVSAQDRTVTGKIISGEDKMPIPGASISVVGTTRGTTTGADGTYKLSVPSGASLRFSSTGNAQQTIPVGSQSVIDVVLQPESSALSEVVVRGYGTQSRKEVTGAVTKVDSKEFNQGAITSPAQLIQGKVAGAVIVFPGGDPNSGFNIRIRGTGSLSGGNNPLFVVDGIPGIDPNTVNPNDIESFDVIKDASAAIYGARAAGGVVLITTKKGKEGRTTVNYSGSMAFESVANMIDMMSADQWRAANTERGLPFAALDRGQNTDWQKEITRSVANQFHTISIAGGTPKTTYSASVNLQKRDGIVRNSGIERMIGNFAVSSKFLDDKLKVTATTIYTSTKNNFVDYEGFRYAFNYNPSFPVYNPDGTFYEVDGFEFNNPLARVMQITNKRKNFNMNSTLQADLTILEGLTATVRGNINQYTGHGDFYAPKASRIGVGDGGRASRGNDNYASNLIEAYANYTKAIGNNKLTVVGGYSWQDFVGDGFNAESRRFITDNFGVNNLGAGEDVRPGFVNSYKYSSTLVSFFGRANFSMADGKYLFEAGVRRDGSSKFGLNNKWGVFPFFSAGWNVGMEDFMANQSIFKTLKVRASYGSIGNQDNINSYASLQLVGPSGKYFDPSSITLNNGYLTGYGPAQNPNPNLRWETTTTTNVGIDFGILNDRITGALEYYIKDSKDVLGVYQVPVPPNLFGNTLANAGSVRNQGFEVVVNGKILRGAKRSWNATVNFSTNDNKVLSLSTGDFTSDEIPIPPQMALGRGISGLVPKILRPGFPAQAFYGAVLEGLYDEGTYKFKDTNGDGKVEPDGADRVLLGQAVPKMQLGITNQVTLGAFDFNVFVRGLFGYQRFNLQRLQVSNMLRLPGENVAVATVVNGIATDKIAGAQRFSSLWVEDADHIRLDNITVGYTLKTNPKYVSTARFFVTGQNLFILTKYSGNDPEGGFDGNNGGIEGLSTYYPRTRTINVGVNLSF